MSVLRVVLGDQLHEEISSLKDVDKENDIIFMCEVHHEASYVKHHKKKLVFIFSAMRHFAQELKEKGYNVDYIRLNDPENTGTFNSEIARVVKRHNVSKIIVTAPSEYRVLERFQSLEEELGCPAEIREDNRFLCTIDDFKKWASGRKSLTMEYFYREMRKSYDILMQDGEPIGGKWNYDEENRKKPPKDIEIPPPYEVTQDSITKDVIDMVDETFPDHFGDILPFHMAVTRKQALQVLEAFIHKRLNHFGDYQDAMIEGEPWMYHAHISFYINCGLLLPLECIKAAEKAYHLDHAPLNSVEGFIRQILGWREYVRGIYWLKMPDYAEENYLQAKRALPELYWGGDTKMNCLKQCVKETKENAYAHHIQRLMVLGNFALIAGLDPKDVNEWFLIVYADAYEWVELPNVSGMILFADGGVLGSKPYAAGGSYINKMSNYCKACSYKVTEKNGPKACPFNYLYWDFLSRHRDKFKGNRRMSMMYSTYDRMGSEKHNQIKSDADGFFKALYQKP
ncbi:MAG: cryptochrome/photolyase family protein [Pseudomonadota bacterium]